MTSPPVPLDLSDLHRVFYNAALFGKKVVRFTFSGDWLTVSSTDDHVILSERLRIPWNGPGDPKGKVYWIELKKVKEIEKALRESSDDFPEDVGWWLDERSMDYSDDYGIWPLLDGVMDWDNDTTFEPAAEPWALNRDRLRLLGLLKTPGDKTYPIDLLHGVDVTLDGRPVTRFKIGPTVRGAVAPLLRETIEEEIPEGLF